MNWVSGVGKQRGRARGLGWGGVGVGDEGGVVGWGRWMG